MGTQANGDLGINRVITTRVHVILSPSLRLRPALERSEGINSAKNLRDDTAFSRDSCPRIRGGQNDKFYPIIL